MHFGFHLNLNLLMWFCLMDCRQFIKPTFVCNTHSTCHKHKIFVFQHKRNFAFNQPWRRGTESTSLSTTSQKSKQNELDLSYWKLCLKLYFAPWKQDWNHFLPLHCTDRMTLTFFKARNWKGCRWSLLYQKFYTSHEISLFECFEVFS